MGLLERVGGGAINAADKAAAAPHAHTPGSLIHEFRCILERIADLLAEIKDGVTDANQQSRYVRRVAQGDADAAGALTLEVDLPANLGWQMISYAGVGATGGIAFYYDDVSAVNIVHVDTTADKFSDAFPPDNFVPPQTKVFAVIEGVPAGTHCVVAIIAKTNEKKPRIRRAEIYEHDHNAGAF